MRAWLQHARSQRHRKAHAAEGSGAGSSSSSRRRGRVLAGRGLPSDSHLAASWRASCRCGTMRAGLCLNWLRNSPSTPFTSNPLALATPTRQLLGQCLAVVAHSQLGHAGGQRGAGGGLGGGWGQLAILLRRTKQGAEEVRNSEVMLAIEAGRGRSRLCVLRCSTNGMAAGLHAAGSEHAASISNSRTGRSAEPTGQKQKPAPA